MLVPREYIQTLFELGLTQTEAKIYITLLCLKCASAKAAHEESKVARQEVYRILSDLEEKGLIEKVISKPAKFRPIPSKEVISLLFRRKKEHNLQLRNKAIKQFKNFEIDYVKAIYLDGDAKFILLSSYETNPRGPINKIGKAIEKAQKSVGCVLSFPFFIKLRSLNEHIWIEAIKRKVEFKVLINGKPNTESGLDLNPILMNNYNFEIRWATIALPAVLVLVDERKTFFRMGYEVDSPVLFSEAPSFVALIKDYFETKWRLPEHNLN